MATRKFLSILLVSLVCLSFLSSVPFVFASTNETRYMQMTSATVNGLYCYILGTSEDVTGGLQAYTRTGATTYVVSWGIRVWKRDNVGTETEITSGTPVAQVSRSSNGGYGVQSATWVSIQTSLASTDSIIVRGYMQVGADDSWRKETTWQTEQLGASQLDSTTWNVTYNTKRSTALSPSRTTGEFRWGKTTQTMNIANFQWTSAPTAEERSFELIETFASSESLERLQGHIHINIESMIPSEILSQWQEHSHVFTEYIIPSATLNQIQGHLYELLETIVPSYTLYQWQGHLYELVETFGITEFLNIWQEQIYTFIEPIQHSATLETLKELAILLFEFFETIKISDILTYSYQTWWFVHIPYFVIIIGFIGFLAFLIGEEGYRRKKK
jgi:hypothetical protein